MTKEEADLMIEHQGVYEIVYQKEGEEPSIWHLSDIEYDEQFSDSCIRAFCIECNKELTFNIKRINSTREYWTGILSNHDTAPCDGLYLIAMVYRLDVDYAIWHLKEGERFSEIKPHWSKPIAFHYIPEFEKDSEIWSPKEILFHKWEDERVEAIKDGIPIIAYINLNDSSSVLYCIGNSYYRDDDCQTQVWGGVSKGTDITTFFKDLEGNGYYYLGWSERWNGYKMLGYLLVCEYDSRACIRHIKQRKIEEPDFF